MHSLRVRNELTYNESESLKSKPETNPFDFVLYVMDISYFSGKMEMYCRYKELKFQRVEPTYYELQEIGTKVCICVHFALDSWLYLYKDWHCASTYSV